ncbi:MAG: hypothetical protein HFH93_05370 [Lachnospiraceae bacterium]|nr:hypothetical protein [Lachnospiraceae bacterium]
MGENQYFQKALADFVRDAAYGGAVRHLTEKGYTVRQIVEQLDFPAPYEKVRCAVWEHLLDTGVILQKEPGSAGRREKATYVKEYDRHGKPTFRRLSGSCEEPEPVCWTEEFPEMEEDAWAEGLPLPLESKLAENGEAYSYASCDFGRIAAKNPVQYEKMLCALGGERDYVEGLPWERCRVYHRLDFHMREILVSLALAGQYQGELFFLKTGNRVKIGEAEDDSADESAEWQDIGYRRRWRGRNRPALRRAGHGH